MLCSQSQKNPNSQNFLFLWPECPAGHVECSSDNSVESFSVKARILVGQRLKIVPSEKEAKVKRKNFLKFMSKMFRWNIRMHFDKSASKFSVNFGKKFLFLLKKNFLKVFFWTRRNGISGNHFLSNIVLTVLRVGLLPS